VARTRLDAVGYADVALPKPAPPTLYGVAGDWLFLAMLAVGLLPAGLRRAG
jgi:hypothetical protein